MNFPTLLIVDDDAALLQNLGRALSRTYRVLLADDAAEAFELLGTESVDLVLSDHHMPGLTGLEFLKQVAIRHPDVLRLLFSAEPDVTMAIKAINQGDVFRILTKPVHLAVDRLQVERENRVLRAVLRAHPELDAEFEAQLARCWSSPPVANRPSDARSRAASR
jgi:DNA-binding NtrC family response regulator